jgi:hypothetical protein
LLLAGVDAFYTSVGRALEDLAFEVQQKMVELGVEPDIVP